MKLIVHAQLSLLAVSTIGDADMSLAQDVGVANEIDVLEACAKTVNITGNYGTKFVANDDGTVSVYVLPGSDVSIEQADAANNCIAEDRA